MAGLIAGTTLSDLHLPEAIRNSILIGVDLEPNLSITGSLVTILWLRELRKNGYEISAWDFLTLGIVVMIPALIGALFVLTINISSRNSTLNSYKILFTPVFTVLFDIDNQLGINTQFII